MVLHVAHERPSDHGAADRRAPEAASDVLLLAWRLQELQRVTQRHALRAQQRQKLCKHQRWRHCGCRLRHPGLCATGTENVADGGDDRSLGSGRVRRDVGQEAAKHSLCFGERLGAGSPHSAQQQARGNGCAQGPAR